MVSQIVTKNLSDALREVLELAVEFAGADFGDIHFVTPDGHLRIFVHEGFPDWWIDYWKSVSLKQGTWGSSISLGKRVVVEDVENSPLFAGSAELDILRQASIRAVQSTPIQNAVGRVIAILSTYCRAPQTPNVKTQCLLDLLSAHATTIIERAKTELSLPQDQYRTVVDDLTEVICRILPDGTFTYVNEVYCRVFGKSAEELLGRRWHPLAHPDDLSIIEAKLREMAPGNSVVTIENRVYVAGGDLRWMQFVNRGSFDTEGNLSEIQSVGRDITSLKHAEAALRDSEATLERAQKVACIGSFALKGDSDHFIHTKETARLFGLDDRLEIRFAEWFARVHQDDKDAVEAAWNAALKGGAYDVTYRIIVRGQVIWIRGVAELTFDDQGRLLDCVGTVQDVSAQRRVEQGLRESQERLEMAMTGSGLTLWDWDIQNQKVTGDQRMYGMLGLSSEELGCEESAWLSLIDPRDREQFEISMAAYLQGDSPSYHSQHRLRHKDGH